MNTRMLKKARKWLALVGVFSIISSMLIAVPTASSYDGSDAPSWASEDVDEACDLELVDCSLDPDFSSTVNRAVGYQMLTSGFEVLSEDAGNPFSDVVGSDWFRDAAGSAYTLGWTSGVVEDGDRMFKPSDALTRSMLAVAGTQILGLEDCGSIPSTYTDAGDVPTWATNAVACMIDSGLMVGSDNQFRPNASLNKVEAIVAMNAWVGHADDNEIDVVEVAAARMEVDADTVYDALETGAFIVDGELVAADDDDDDVVADDDDDDDDDDDVVADDDDDDDDVVAADSLSVALASDTPATATIPPGANSAPVARFTLSVASGEATVSGLTLKRIGGGAPADFSSVTIYEGDTRLRSGKTISTDTNTVDFGGLSLTVKAGSPVTVEVRGDLTTTAAAASTHQFGLEAASSVTTNAGSVVGAPVYGNVVTIGGATVQTVTIAPANTLSKPTLGQKKAEVANFRLTAGSNDVDFTSVILTHGGTLSRTSMNNLVLEDSSGNTLATTAAVSSGDLVVFTPAEAFKVPKNNNRVFRVYADLTGGKTTDTLDFYIDETSDLTAVDAQAGYGARVTNSMAKANVTDTTFQGGKITLADNGPVATNVAINSTNVELFNFSITADRDLTFKDYYLWLEQTAFPDATAAAGLGNVNSRTVGAAVVTGITTAGVVALRTNVDEMANLAIYDVLKVTSGGIDYYVELTATPIADTTTAGTIAGTLVYPASVANTISFAMADVVTKVYDSHLRSNVKNVRLIDADSGSTLASSSTSAYRMVFSDDFDISEGQTRNLQVLVDLDTSLVAAVGFKGGVDFGEASFIKDNDANEFVAVADCVACNTFGKSMTSVASSLTVTLATTPVTETHVKGQTDVDLVGLSAKAGDGGDVKVIKVTARLVADDDGTFAINGYGDLAANTLVDSVSLVKVNSDGTTSVIGKPVGVTAVGTIGADGGYYKAEFNTFEVDGATVSNYTIAKSVTEKWLVRVNLRSSISATRYLAADVISGTDIETQDKDGNTVTPSGTTNGLGTALTVTKTIATAGTLTGASEGNPNASILVAGATGQVMSKYKYSAQNEAFTVEKLDVVMDENDDFTTATPESTRGGSYKKVGVTYTKKDGTSVTTYSDLSAGKASFTNLAIYVPKDGNALVTVIADLNSTETGAVSGAAMRLGLNEAALANNTFEALGEGSSEKLTATDLSTYSASSTVKTMTLRKSAPTVAAVASPGSKLNNGSSKPIAEFTVTTDAKTTVSLKRVVLDFSSSDMDVSALGLFRKIGSGSEGEITTDLSIRNRAGQNLKSGGSNLASAGGATTDNVYLTWDKATTDEENVSGGNTSGTTNTYTLKATIANAAANESLSSTIPDDTATFNAPVNGVSLLRTNTTATNPETTAASVAGIRTVWYWVYATAACPNTNVAGCVFMDTQGDGTYTAASDPMIVVDTTGVGATSGLTSLALVPGPLRYTTTDVGGNEGDAGYYFDLDGGGTYVTTTDIAFGATAASGGAATNNSLVTNDIRYNATSSNIYVDRGAGDVFTNAGDDEIKVDTVPTTAPANNAELFTTGWNFIWSDNSATPHTTSTTDWTNGTNVNSLALTTGSLSF